MEYINTTTNPIVPVPVSWDDLIGSVTPTLGSMSLKNFWVGTQAEYDAIVTKDNNTLYFIKE